MRKEYVYSEIYVENVKLPNGTPWKLDTFDFNTTQETPEKVKNYCQNSLQRLRK